MNRLNTFESISLSLTVFFFKDDTWQNISEAILWTLGYSILHLKDSQYFHIKYENILLKLQEKKKAINLNYCLKWAWFQRMSFQQDCLGSTKSFHCMKLWFPFISNAEVLVTFRTITFMNHFHDCFITFYQVLYDINGCYGPI